MKELLEKCMKEERHFWIRTKELIAPNVYDSFCVHERKRNGKMKNNNNFKLIEVGNDYLIVEEINTERKNLVPFNLILRIIL